MKQVRFISDARREFLTTTAFYEEAMPGLGSSFAKAVEQAAGRTLIFPLSGKSTIGDTRCVDVPGFPVSIFFRADNSGTLIFAVARPSHWNNWGGLTRD